MVIKWESLPDIHEAYAVVTVTMQHYLTKASGVVLGSPFRAQIQDIPDNGLEDIDAAETVALNTTASDIGASGIPLWVYILVGVLFIGMLLAVFLLRHREQGASGDTENPLFEDKYGISDDEIEIEGSLNDDYAEVVIEEEETEPIRSQMVDETLDDTRSIFSHHGDDDVDEDVSHDEGENDYDDEDDTNLTADEIYSSEQSAEENDQDSENIIRFNPQPEEDDMPSGQGENEEVTIEDQPHEDSGEKNVSYAYASNRAQPIAFSGISTSEEDHSSDANADIKQETSSASGRPYIAPTVLREDMEKIERHQAARLDEVNADLGRQITALKAEQNNRLDLIINALDRRLEGLAEATKKTQEESIQPFAAMTPELTRQLASVQASMDSQSQRIRAITQILDDRLASVAHVYGEVKNTNERLENLSSKLEALEKSFTDKTQSDVIADVQLSDVIRSSLAPENYEFKPLLSNNNRADCLIKLPHPPGAIVVDTKFPLDAFNALPARADVAKGQPQAKAAEDAFRRAVLRHIIDVAERYIIPGETADSALLFLPTEAIYTTLHARFPDLVRDSFRARVWIVSPSTLMGTLQTLRGVLRDSRERENAETVRRETNEVMAEVEALRSQASMLARNFESTQSELRSLLDATDKVMSKGGPAPAPHSEKTKIDLRDQLYDHKPEWPGQPKDSSPSTSDPGNGHRSTSLFDDPDANPDKLR
ncbi:MAG: DNA recombination protein RmuC [bacterium]